MSEWLTGAAAVAIVSVLAGLLIEACGAASGIWLPVPLLFLGEVCFLACVGLRAESLVCQSLAVLPRLSDYERCSRCALKLTRTRGARRRGSNSASASSQAGCCIRGMLVKL